MKIGLLVTKLTANTTLAYKFPFYSPIQCYCQHFRFLCLMRRCHGMKRSNNKNSCRLITTAAPKYIKVTASSRVYERRVIRR
jgi:hypothetical protein